MRGRSSFVRVTAAAILLLPLLLALPACFSTHVVSRDDVAQERIPKGQQLRLIYPQGSVTLYEEWTVDYPYVEGEIDELTGTVPRTKVEGTKRERFNLEDAVSFEAWEFKRGRTTGLALGSSLGFVALVLALVFAVGPGLSCPHVYAGTGTEAVLIGEAYPGAMFRTMQRPDMLLLPDGVSTISIRNDHEERQLIDLARIAIVDHQPHQRVIPTRNGPLVVEDRIAPSHVLANGSGALALVNEDDGRAWQSTPGAASEDVLTAEFDVPAGDYLVVVRAENTRWYEAAIATAIRSAGADYTSLLASNDTASAARLQQWRDDADLDLVVATGTTTQRNTPFGTGGFRTVGVTEVRADGTRTTKVALRSGAHYWRFDSIALMRIVDRNPRITMITPSCDAPACIAKLRDADRSYIELHTRGERLDLQFARSDHPEASTAFLMTSGYYTVNPISTAPGELRSLRVVAEEMSAPWRDAMEAGR